MRVGRWRSLPGRHNLGAKAPAASTILSGHAIHRRVLAVVLILGLVTRVAGALLTGGDAFRFMDEVTYADAAERLRSGAGLGPDYLGVPGYPAFLALLGLIVPNGVLALRLAQTTLLALGGIVCFELGRILGGRSAGLATTALYSLDPLLVLSAGLLYPEAAAALLLTGALLTAWHGVQRGRLALILMAGLQLGLLTLFRPVSLVLAPAMMGWVGLAPGQRWRSRAAYIAVLASTWLLVVLPYARRQAELHGEVFPQSFAGLGGVPAIREDTTLSGVASALAGAAQRDPPGFARRTFREFAHFWELYPTRVATDDSVRRAGLAERDARLATTPVVQPSVRNIASALSFGLELALASLGLVVAWRSRRRETAWLVALVLSFALGYSLFYGKLRYRIPILPIVLAFAGLGLATLVGRLGWPAGTRPAAR